MENLNAEEFVRLVERVFRPGPSDRSLGVLLDLPDPKVPDSEAWRVRRHMAWEWVEISRLHASERGFDVAVVLYRNVRANNAELPQQAWIWPAGTDLPSTADELPGSEAVPFSRVYEALPLIMAPTEFSATAPLKNAARRFGFRAATMGGFLPEMIPALRIDYEAVKRRVDLLKDLLDRAWKAHLLFLEMKTGTTYSLDLDLRYRSGHASSGLLWEPGTAGNLPSGEAYIVPYEGERAGEPSLSEGLLPVQFEDEIAVYRIRQNRVLAVEGTGGIARREAERLSREPAYGNLAELGLGVIHDFGIPPCGSILLDEKLGLHIAFGRSDHFGGQVGASAFSSPESVVHIDRVYIPEIQPDLLVQSVDLEMPGNEKIPIMRDWVYVLDFQGSPR